MFSHWSRPQLDLATHAVQEVVHRKQNLSTRGCVILYTFRRKLVDNLLCLWESLLTLKEAPASKDEERDEQVVGEIVHGGHHHTRSA